MNRTLLARWRRCGALIGALAALATSTAQAQVDPGKDFFGNFWEPAYFMPVYPLPGEVFGGDLTATYDQAYVPNRPNLELLLIGEFPRARFFSITVYDDHGAIIDSITDAELEPMFAAQGNPYRPGGPTGTEDILYAVRVKLGDGLNETPSDGCAFNGADVTSNVLDATRRHNDLSRYSDEIMGFTVSNDDGSVVIEHDDAIPNDGVTVMVRRYLEADDGNTGSFDVVRPLAFLRSTDTGCAFDLWDLIQVPQPDPSIPLPPNLWYTWHSTVDQTQVAAHFKHAADYPPGTPYGLDPNNRYAWYRSAEYILSANAETDYVASIVPMPGKPATLNSKNKVMRMRFKLPTLPCQERVCAISGDEEMRYWGMSIVEGNSTVIASLSDLDLTPEPDGYVTLIFTFGTALPPHVNAANGYSVVSLPVSDMRQVTIRNILPAETFKCQIDNVPIKTNEHHANGGYMGEYIPYVDFPFASVLPEPSNRYDHPDSCELPPE